MHAKLTSWQNGIVLAPPGDGGCGIAAGVALHLDLAALAGHHGLRVDLGVLQGAQPICHALRIRIPLFAYVCCLLVPSLFHFLSHPKTPTVSDV